MGFILVISKLSQLFLEEILQAYDMGCKKKTQLSNMLLFFGIKKVQGNNLRT